MLLPFNELFKKHQVSFKGIVHCGASTGQERDHYDSLGVQVIWIEAIKSVFDELQQNIAHYPNQIAIHACLGEKDWEHKVFNISNNEAQSSSYLQLAFHKIAHPSVHYIGEFHTYTQTLETILEGLKVDIGEGEWLLVGDLQGAEMFMLKGAGKYLSAFDGCYLEVNTKEVYEFCSLKHEIEEYLAKYDFFPVEELIYENFGWGDEFLLKSKLIQKS